MEATFPKTEAWKQSLELLAKADASLVSAAITAVSTSRIDGSVVPKTLAGAEKQKNFDVKLFMSIATFIVDQFTYFVVAPEQVSGEMLAGPENSLSSSTVEAIRSAWADQGKAVVAAVRKQCVVDCCGGASHNLLVANPHVQQFVGGCEEEPVKDSDEIDIVTTVSAPSHRAQATIRLPPIPTTGSEKEALQDGPILTLGLQDAYTLFTEIDAIQEKLDTLAQA